ncbi:hypothetical protein GCM10011495_18580 [Hymenobacter frigidus]|uniref:DUF4394 domain-containing protein n=1 Tax=Hymenobacter frigidus TaxID=1524095 RepID=A0ABQ2A5E9_9BACT|nr:DUF4394 domain-containing protein [Hymenobacter frigidus]GGH85109.1 hypothetical protein GCM10011495_18580 [Hymenobacter frigidus]
MGLGTITGSNFRGEPVGAQGLVLIDPNSGAAQNLAPVRIAGVAAGQTLIGIDYRPADNLLYTLGYDATTVGANAQLYLLNPGTNVASPIGSAIRLELGGPSERISFDFNPTVDRIRVVSSNDTNYRLNPVTGSIAATDGTLAYAAGDPNAGINPGVGAIAYTNSTVGTAATTTLYDFDYRNNGVFSIQNPPNAGTLNTQSTVVFVITGGSAPGTYGIGQPDAIGLDIYFNPGNNTNVGYVTEVTAPRSNGARATNTYRLDLATGVATQLGNTVPASNLLNFEIRDLAVTLAPPVLVTWNGSVSTDWRTAANWTPAFVPTAATDVVIPGGTPFQPIVSTNQQTRAITLNTGALLTTADGSNLVVGGNFTNNDGTLAGSGSGTVVLDLNTAQTIGGTSSTTFQNLTIGLGTANLATAASLAASASVRRLLTLYGDLTVTGQTFTLLSDANNTAQVVNISGSVVGAATVQRYIDPSRNGGVGYRHYSPPVSGSTVNDLTTTGYAPIVNPNYNTIGNTVRPFPTVFGYDENRVNTSGSPVPMDFDKGFFSPNSLGDGLEATRGYTVNIPATANVDFVGTLNNGPLTAGGLTRGGQAESGYHLRGNPYPAPLDWQAMINAGRLTNVDNALYVFKSSGQYTGSYASYINGVGVNGGTNILPSSQGFFVRTSAPSQVGSISFTNQERLTTYNNTPFQRGTADDRAQLTLTLRNVTAATQTAVYFEQGATAAFDRAFDAADLPNSNGLTLATEAGAEAVAINGLPVLTGTDVVLPLRLSAAAAGSYTLAVDNLTNLPTNYRAYLRDVLTGTYSDLATTPAVSLTLAANGATSGRYAVVFSTQNRVLATAPAALARLATVYPNPAHSTATLLLPVALRGTTATTVVVVDNLGRTVLTRTLAAGTTEALELPLAGLAPGVYSVLARTAAGLVAKRLVIQ